MKRLLDRFLMGEFLTVWDEISLITHQSSDLSLYNEIQQIVRITMERIRDNLALLVPRLEKMGFVFGAGFLDDVPLLEREVILQEIPILAKPLSHTFSLLDSLESEVGSLPLTIRLWYEIVGSVNLVGRMPKWQQRLGDIDIELDPLFIYPLPLVLQMIEPFREKISTNIHNTVSLSPDSYNKMNMSGGSPYSFSIPATTIDCSILYERHNTTFINYLRICLKWGGMPGLELANNPPMSDIQYLTQGFALF